MTQRAPIIINGQQIGRLKASWLLFKESWNFLRADKEMMWIPLITAALNLFLFGILVAVFLLSGAFAQFEAQQSGNGYLYYEFVFGGYVIGAFTLALAQAAIAHTVYTRIKGGDATLGESLKVAFSHWVPLLLWSLITSTVGIVLRVIAERSELIGKIISLILGTAWAVLTFFVVPAMVIDNKSPFASIKKSTQVFKATWGETIVSSISLSLTVLLAILLPLLAIIGLMFVVYTLALPAANYIVLSVAYIVWLALVMLVSSVLDGVLRTLLYVYAAEGIRPANFNPELLDKMLARSTPAPIPAPTQTIVQ